MRTKKQIEGQADTFIKSQKGEVKINWLKFWQYEQQLIRGGLTSKDAEDRAIGIARFWNRLLELGIVHHEVSGHYAILVGNFLGGPFFQGRLFFKRKGDAMQYLKLWYLNEPIMKDACVIKIIAI